MKKINSLLSISCIVLLSISATGQTTIDAEIRPRSEFRQGFSQPIHDTLKPAFVTLQRTRLNFNYKAGIVSVRVTLQDSRVFGETNTRQPSSAGTGSIGIYEAWSELLLLSGTSIKIGRQGLQFEDGRLFGLSNWSNTGNAHDLAQIRYFAKDLDIQSGYAYNNQKAYIADTSYYSVSQMYKQLAYFHLTKTLVNGLDLSLLGVGEGFVTSKKNLDLYHRFTTGGTLQLKKDNLPLGFIATGYYQFGKNAPTVDASAFLLALKATYSFTKKIDGIAGIDYYSGSKSDLEATKTNTWNKLLYGVNHLFNGYMEYWAVIPKGGLVNYYGGVNLKLSKKLNSDITYYGFSLAKGMKDANVDIKKNLGSEVDIVLNYKFSAETAIQFAWCTYFVTDGVEMLKLKSTNVDTKFPQYAYIMLTIKPQLYKTPVVAESK